MFDFIFRSILIEFLGVLAKWVFYAFSHKMRGKKVVGFLEIWDGRKNINDPENVLHGMSNILTGYLVIAILIGLGFIIDAIWY